MSDSNSAVLQQAYDLVESGQTEDARRLVESVLDAEQNNPDAWWIYAHAVDDPVLARQALDEVTALDPDYPGATELASVLDAQYPDAAEAARSAPPILSVLAASAVAASAVFVPDAEPESATASILPGDTRPIGDEAEPSFVSEVPPVTPIPVAVPVAEPRRNNSWLWILAALIGMLVIIILLFLIGQLGPKPTVTSELTSVAANATSAAVTPGLQETLIAAGAVTPIPGLDVTEVIDSVATDLALVPPTGIVATLPLDAFVTLTPGTSAETVEAVATSEVIGQPTTEPPPTTTGAQETAEVLVVVETTVPTEEPGVAVETATVISPELAAIQTAAPGLNIPNTVVVILPPDALAQLVTGLSAYVTPEDTALTTETTPLGETLVAGFCTQEGPELRDLTRQVMDTVATASTVMGPSTTAVGVRATDCSTGETLRLIVVDRTAATVYTAGEISREGFESQWISL